MRAYEKLPDENTPLHSALHAKKMRTTYYALTASRSSCFLQINIRFVKETHKYFIIYSHSLRCPR